mmetsp:Transcript_110938/g.318722  ORF Transcript_110938/g.318722 Transcript_110938/m.318722 type:complete len:318 (+) Transcript_110938:700-1653(+)
MHQYSRQRAVVRPEPEKDAGDGGVDLVQHGRERVRVVKHRPLAAVLELVLLELPEARISMLVVAEVFRNYGLARPAALALRPQLSLPRDFLGQLGEEVLFAGVRPVQYPELSPLAGLDVRLTGIAHLGEVEGVVMPAKVQGELGLAVREAVADLAALLRLDVPPALVEEDLDAVGEAARGRVLLEEPLQLIPRNASGHLSEGPLESPAGLDDQRGRLRHPTGGLLVRPFEVIGWAVATLLCVVGSMAWHLLAVARRPWRSKDGFSFMGLGMALRPGLRRAKDDLGNLRRLLGELHSQRRRPSAANLRHDGLGRRRGG